MPANWSLILNVLLLIGVVFAIARVMQNRRQQFKQPEQTPALGKIELKPFDDIIAVRKISPDLYTNSVNSDIDEKSNKPIGIDNNSPEIMITDTDCSKETIMMFISAKENRQLAGYELLQTILSAGLRFGEGNLFHLHQQGNGQGTVICTLAAATNSGTFDLQNIGAFSVRGLCLFMQASGNSTIDEERFKAMLQTARQLSEGLDALLLSENQKPLCEKSLNQYYQKLGISAIDELITA